jgi:ABC-type lipoprotein release transport system permease subunit
MNVFRMIFKEILHRKFNFLLSVLGILSAVAFTAAFFTTGEASKNETTRLMRDIGYNLRIIPKEASMEDFWSRGYSEETMPEEYIRRFADKKGISYAHLLATLQKRIDWQGRTALLTGIATEVDPGGKGKSPMIFEIKPGEVFLGSEVGEERGIKTGDTVEIAGRTLKVVKALAESGTVDDLRIYGRLDEVQALLGTPGRINEIKALECLCSDPHVDTLAMLREQLSQILPEAKVIRMEQIAEAREKQRFLVENYFALLMPVVILLCALWVGALAMLNTRERENEIGILRALGFGSGTIAALFLGKAVLAGLAGALAGFWIGTGAAMEYGPDLFKVTEGIVQPDYRVLAWALAAAPLFAALSSFIPAMIAVTQDPAATLRVE